MFRYTQRMLITWFGLTVCGCAAAGSLQLNEDTEIARRQLAAVLPPGLPLLEAERVLLKGGFTIDERGIEDGEEFIYAVKSEMKYGIQARWRIVVYHDGESIRQFENYFGYTGP